MISYVFPAILIIIAGVVIPRQKKQAIQRGQPYDVRAQWMKVLIVVILMLAVSYFFHE